MQQPLGPRRLRLDQAEGRHRLGRLGLAGAQHGGDRLGHVPHQGVQFGDGGEPRGQLGELGEHSGRRGCLGRRGGSGGDLDRSGIRFQAGEIGFAALDPDGGGHPAQLVQARPVRGVRRDGQVLMVA